MAAFISRLNKRLVSPITGLPFQDHAVEANSNAGQFLIQQSVKHDILGTETTRAAQTQLNVEQARRNKLQAAKITGKLEKNASSNAFAVENLITAGTSLSCITASSARSRRAPLCNAIENQQQAKAPNQSPLTPRRSSMSAPSLSGAPRSSLRMQKYQNPNNPRHLSARSRDKKPAFNVPRKANYSSSSCSSSSGHSHDVDEFKQSYTAADTYVQSDNSHTNTDQSPPIGIFELSTQVSQSNMPAAQQLGISESRVHSEYRNAPPVAENSIGKESAARHPTPDFGTSPCRVHRKESAQFAACRSSSHTRTDAKSCPSTANEHPARLKSASARFHDVTTPSSIVKADTPSLTSSSARIHIRDQKPSVLCSSKDVSYVERDTGSTSDEDAALLSKRNKAFAAMMREEEAAHHNQGNTKSRRKKTKLRASKKKTGAKVKCRPKTKKKFH